MSSLTNSVYPGFRPRRQRLALFCASLLLAVLQVAAVAHLVAHATTGDTTGCEICLNAGHAGAAMVPAKAVEPGFRVIAVHLLSPIDSRGASRSPVVQRARGPPLSV